MFKELIHSFIYLKNFVFDMMYASDDYNGKKFYVFYYDTIYVDDVYNSAGSCFGTIQYMQMVFIITQQNSILVYTAQPDSFAYLICYEMDLDHLSINRNMILY